MRRTRLKSMSEHRPVQRDLDRLFKRFIIERAGGVCERCHRAPAVDPCHVFTSRIEGTRWDPDNAWAGCRACHDWTHSHVAFTKTWNQRRLGPDRYRALQLRHNERNRPDYTAMRDKLVEALECRPRWEAALDANLLYGTALPVTHVSDGLKANGIEEETG